MLSARALKFDRGRRDSRLSLFEGDDGIKTFCSLFKEEEEEGKKKERTRALSLSLSSLFARLRVRVCVCNSLCRVCNSLSLSLGEEEKRGRSK